MRILLSALALVATVGVAGSQTLPKGTQIVDKLPPGATGIFTTAAMAQSGMAWEYKNGKRVAIHGQVPPEQFDHQYLGNIQVLNYPTDEAFTGKCKTGTGLLRHVDVPR